VAAELGSTVGVSNMRAFIMPTQGGSMQYNIRSGIRIIPPVLRAQGSGCMNVAPWPCRTQVAEAGSVLYNIRFSGYTVHLASKPGVPHPLGFHAFTILFVAEFRHNLLPGGSHFGGREEQQGRLLVDSAAREVARRGVYTTEEYRPEGFSPASG